MKQLSWLLMCGFCSVLAACGGGGGGVAAAPHVPLPDTGSEPEPEPVPLGQPDGEAVSEADTEPADPAPVPADEFAMLAYSPAPSPDEEDASEAPAAAWAGPARVFLHVSTKGSDRNPGSAQRPFRSLARAAKASRAGTTVLVAPGIYSGGLRSTANGTAERRISFVSTVKWGAKILPPKNSPNKTAWDNRGSYVDIIGFDVDGSRYQGGRRWTNGIYSGGSYVTIRNNHVHHIARDSACTRAGGAAIGVDSYYKGVKSDVLSNLVHDIGPAGCRYVQGIYVSTSGRIKNNVVFRVAEGGIHLWHDAHNVIITNNTVTASRTGIIVGGGNFYHTRGPNDHTSVFSNIVYDNEMGISEQGKTGPNNSYRNNLVFQNRRYDWRLKNGLTHSATVSAAPLFVDSARRGTPTLRLTPASPAIGRASPVYAETTDFAGRPRGAATGYDIGALQH
jgi:parallel beta-helix repeat protein